MVTSASVEDVVPTETVLESQLEGPAASRGRGWRFWLVFLGLCLGTAVNAIELSSVSTALPTIIHDLGGGTSFIWVGAAYTLCSTAFVPLTGGLAEVFGRRPILLASLLIMSAGSAVCGAATSMSMLIGGRVVQGLGGGGVASLTAIIIADLVSLRERGMFSGFLSMAWAFFTGAGPVVAGALAQDNAWRWLFYLNIPFCAVSGLLIVMFLRVPTPPGTVREKLGRIDITGNALVIGASTSTIIGVTWAGVTYPWGAWQVLVPLVVGLVGLVGFMVYEARLASHPVAPVELLSNRTSSSGYFQLFIYSMMLVQLSYYVPVYLQACKGLSPLHSGIDLLAVSLLVASFAIVGGISTAKTGYYRPQAWLGWVLAVVGAGLLVMIRADSDLALLIVFIAITSAGIGLVNPSANFTILAPVSVTLNSRALAFSIFVRSFAQVWGITIGGAVLQNALQSRISSDVLTSGAGVYSLIPTIPAFPEPLRSELVAAFGDSIREVWVVMVVMAGLGLLSSLVIRAYTLSTTVDEKWAMQHDKRSSQAMPMGSVDLKDSARNATV